MVESPSGTQQHHLDLDFLRHHQVSHRQQPVFYYPIARHIQRVYNSAMKPNDSDQTTDNTPDQTQTTEPEQSAPAPDPSTIVTLESKPRRTWLYVLVAMLILVAGAGAYWFANQDSGQNPQAVSSRPNYLASNNKVFCSNLGFSTIQCEDVTTHTVKNIFCQKNMTA